MRQRVGKLGWLILFALAYGTMTLALNDRPLTELHDVSPYHRYQAAALLHGHFYLAGSIDALQPGLAWHDGKVQQVWGLGVAFWLVPFQAIWGLLGGRVFPDRIALGVAFSLLAFYSGSTGLKIIRQGQRAFGLGLIWLIVLCPAVWTLARVSQLIFEETVLYAILLSLGVLVAVIRVALFGSRVDYFLCCALSLFTLWVRPTHAIYGLSAVLISSFIVWTRRRKAGEATIGAAVWLASAVLLTWTNNTRFGSPTEFGHRLTASTGSMVYLTRFGNPFHEASPSEAAKELFGGLFLNSNVRDAAAFTEDLFPGQSAHTRWRRLYFTTFDPSFAVLSLTALTGATLWLVRRYKSKNRPPWQSRNTLIVALLLWSGASSLALAALYLYYPALASRYLLDFAPALTGFIAAAWTGSSTRWPKCSLALLAVWLVYEIVTARVPTGKQSPRAHAPAQLTLSRARGVSLIDFQGAYTISHHPTETVIAGNGYGWDPAGGFASDVVTLAVDKPQFVELQVSMRRGFNGEPARKDVYRAQIDGQSLSLREVKEEEEQLKVVFDVPDSIRSRQQDEILFLCFSAGYDAQDRASERFLYSVRWR